MPEIDTGSWCMIGVIVIYSAVSASGGLGT